MSELIKLIQHHAAQGTWEFIFLHLGIASNSGFIILTLTCLLCGESVLYFPVHKMCCGYNKWLSFEVLQNENIWSWILLLTCFLSLLFSWISSLQMFSKLNHQSQMESHTAPWKSQRHQSSNFSLVNGELRARNLVFHSRNAPCYSAKLPVFYSESELPSIEFHKVGESFGSHLMLETTPPMSKYLVTVSFLYCRSENDY